MSTDWPAADALLASRYRLVSLLETGGMAEIWRARDELLDRPVAVKLPKGPQVVWREARMAAKLSHPGIAAVHDYREALRPDGSIVPFVVMELLAGESVAARVERELFGWAEAARVGAAVADALAAAHASGVVHRDIKPGNVMLTPNGVKILDFGISASAGEPDDDDTGATFGTPAYVAPERLDGGAAEPATDVYGLGVLLFEMVTGDPPYPVDTWEELAVARTKGAPRLPRSLPGDFREVVMHCLDDDPDARPTAARLRADLLAVALRSRPEGAPLTRTASGRRRNAFAHAGDGGETSGRLSDLGFPTDGSRGEDEATAWVPTAVSLGDRDAEGRTPNGAPTARASLDSAGGRTSLGAAGGRSSLDPSGGRTSLDSTGGRSSLDSSGGRTSLDSSGGRTSLGAGDRAPSGGLVASGGRTSSDGPISSGRSSSGRGQRVAAINLDAPDAGYATGRASAATIDMAPPPRRRLAVTIGAAAALAAAAGAFAAIAWTHRDTGAQVDAQPPATYYATPLQSLPASAAPSSAAPTTTSPSPAATTTRPVPRATLSYADAVSRMRSAVQTGVDDGQIREDVGLDLLNLLGPLSTANASDVDAQVAFLRQKIQTRLGEGALTEARATVLQSRLNDLDRAAGT